MLSEFLERFPVVAYQNNIRTVYFHIFSRFDGILMLKYYASHESKYTFKPMIRNLMLYELVVSGY